MQSNKVSHLRMTVFPSEGGKTVTKSIDTWDQGRCGTGKDLSRPAGGLWETFLRAQTGQAEGHQQKYKQGFEPEF